VHYRSVLKNKGIVDEAEKILCKFKPVTYDVSMHVKAIETFENKVVRFLPSLRTCPSWIAKAKETKVQIDVELKDLQATLSNIQDARPFEDLMVRLFPATTYFPGAGPD
jgi:F-type H+-transporting ATPase subunit d